MHLALLFLLYTIQVESTCPIWGCSDTLATGVCVEYTDNYKLSINANGCSATSPYCDLDDVKLWYGTAGVGWNYTCSATNFTSYWTVPDNQNYLVCGSRLYQKDLMSGSNPKLCSDNTDCELEDGTYGECQCGLNGQMYCKPDLNSDAFDGYWSQCCSVGCGILDTFDHYLYWYLKYTYYVDYISGYSCSKTFSQLKDIDSLDYYGSGAYEMVLTLSALFLL